MEIDIVGIPSVSPGDGEGVNKLSYDIHKEFEWAIRFSVSASRRELSDLLMIEC